MNAAKRIRHFIESGEYAEQVEVLKALARALEYGDAFDVRSLYEIDMRYFEAALELMRDWRFDQHIQSRSRLIEMLQGEETPRSAA